MKILNLVNKDTSEIKYEISKYPDGQRNVTLTSVSKITSKTITNYTSLDVLREEGILIRTRLNNFSDLELLICAVSSLRYYHPSFIDVDIPYFLGSRSDRKFVEGGNNYLKDVICPIINSLGFRDIYVKDVHSDVLEGCLKGLVKISNTDLIYYAIRDLYGATESNELKLDNFTLISPDTGASKKIYKIAEQIGYKGDIITCSKDRDMNGKLTKCVVPITDTILKAKKDYVIIDDICDGGATFINIAKEIKSTFSIYGKTETPKIYLIVTHGIFSKGFEELAKYFDGIYTTNSYGQLHSNVEDGTGRKIDQWVGPTDEHYWSEIPKDFIKQLNVF